MLKNYTLYPAGHSNQWIIGSDQISTQIDDIIMVNLLPKNTTKTKHHVIQDIDNRYV